MWRRAGNVFRFNLRIIGLKAFENKDNSVIIKVGLITDKEHWSSEDKPEREYIWFELTEEHQTAPAIVRT